MQWLKTAITGKVCDKKGWSNCVFWDSCCKRTAWKWFMNGGNSFYLCHISVIISLIAAPGWVGFTAVKLTGQTLSCLDFMLWFSTINPFIRAVIEHFIFATRRHSIPEQIEMKSTDGRRYFLPCGVKLKASYLKCQWIEGGRGRLLGHVQWQDYHKSSIWVQVDQHYSRCCACTSDTFLHQSLLFWGTFNFPQTDFHARCCLHYNAQSNTSIH